MKKIFLFLFALLAVPFLSVAQGDEDREMMNRGKARDQKEIDEAINGWWTASMKNHDQRIQWWRRAKFGMFIHWGIYSLPGGEWKGKKVSGYAEHLMRKEKITRADYLELAHRFNPVQFNAEEWVLNAKRAGMNYMVITAKHHDGFAMYPSAVSDFNIRKQTPFKRDPMAELSAACKKYGLKFGFYYSHAFDWEHSDAPGNDWEYRNPGGDLNLFGGRNWYDLHPELLPKAKKYVDEKAIPQIKELLLRYHPDILWFDTPQKLPLSENIRILKAIREVDKNVVVNGRLVRFANSNFGDYKNTADRPAEFFPVTGDWEAIPTTNESYGYHKFDSSHKPVSHFIRLIANAASRGGNLLMNIGPMGTGKMDDKDVNILRGIGAWTSANKESIYNVSPSSLPLQSWGVSTLHGKRLYLHVFNWPANGHLLVGGLQSRISKAFLLTRPGKILSTKRLGSMDVQVGLPATAPDTANTVIVLELAEKLKADTVRLLQTDMITRLLAFDATLQGNGFNYGDGKSSAYFAEGWKTKEQQVSWKIRTLEPATFHLIIKYVSAPETAGRYLLKAGTAFFNANVAASPKNTIITEELGVVQLASGVNNISLSPVEITGSELMKILELQLVPVIKK